MYRHRGKGIRNSGWQPTRARRPVLFPAPAALSFVPRPSDSLPCPRPDEPRDDTELLRRQGSLHKHAPRLESRSAVRLPSPLRRRNESRRTEWIVDTTIPAAGTQSPEYQAAATSSTSDRAGGGVDSVSRFAWLHRHADVWQRGTRA